MLGLDDERWSSFKGGYRTPFDPRPSLVAIESGTNVDAAWHALWEGLHHQGDVGDASYATVPHLVRIHRKHGGPDWNTYALVAIIELAREQGKNPKVPDWLEHDYSGALQDLAVRGATELARADNPDEVRAILSVLALSKGARSHARMLVNYSEEELKELESGDR